MPIREYQCASCHAEFEELVCGDAAPACPACGSSRVEALMSCCCVRGTGTDGGYGSSGGCAGCSGGSCASCH